MANDFKAALNQELRQLKKQYNIKDDKAFLIWFGIKILELEEDTAFEAITVEGANDKGIDLFYIDNEKGVIFIAQGKYSKDLNFRPKEGHVSNLESSLNWLASPESLAREGKKELEEVSKEYIEARKKGYSVELIYFYLGRKSLNIAKKIGVFNQNPDNIAKSISIRHYHLDLIKDLWEEVSKGRLRIQKETFKVVNPPLEVTGKFGSALVCTVPCSEIVRLYKNHEDRLFDRNIRLFLGSRKGSVNAGIASTITDTKNRANFWAYNNGITLVCDKYKEKENTVEIINFSIVNGCQTAVSLAENGGDHPDLSVLVRCIAASASIVNDVIRYTNSQNPIKSWDIASQHPTQRRLKTEFSVLNKPYIYLTRRGDRPSSLKKFKDNGKLRQIRIEDAGQYLAAFKGSPVLSYKNKDLIYSRYLDDVFPQDIRVEEVLLSCICGSISKQVVQDLMKSDEDYERILKKGGKFFVLAVMAQIITERNGTNYLAVISEDRITSARAIIRLHQYSKYSANLYVSSVLDESEIHGGELTTLIKQSEFFEKVLKRSIRQYRKDVLNPQWLEGALPKIV